MKTKILNELKNGKKHNFYKQCFYKDYAFDAEVDGRKFEIHPLHYTYGNGNAEAVDCKSFDRPIEISYSELSMCLG